jgi:hypothetical protein
MNISLKLIGIFSAALVVGMVAPFCFDIWKRLRGVRRNDGDITEKLGK